MLYRHESYSIKDFPTQYAHCHSPAILVILPPQPSLAVPVTAAQQAAYKTHAHLYAGVLPISLS